MGDIGMVPRKWHNSILWKNAELTQKEGPGVNPGVDDEVCAHPSRRNTLEYECQQLHH